MLCRYNCNVCGHEITSKFAEISVRLGYIQKYEFTEIPTIQDYEPERFPKIDICPECLNYIYGRARSIKSNGNNETLDQLK